MWPCGTDLSLLSEYHLSGSKHNQLMMRDGTKMFEAFFSALLSLLPSDITVAEYKQEKELDKELFDLVEVSQSISG